MLELDIVFARNLPMPMNQSGNSSIKSSVDPMDLAAGTVAGLVTVAVETGAGHGGFGARLHDGDGTIHLHNC